MSCIAGGGNKGTDGAVFTGVVGANTLDREKFKVDRVANEGIHAAEEEASE